MGPTYIIEVIDLRMNNPSLSHFLITLPLEDPFPYLTIFVLNLFLNIHKISIRNKLIIYKKFIYRIKTFEVILIKIFI